MILRVKKRGDGRSASPTVRFEGKRALGERGPWELFGGAPRRCGSASVVQRPRGSQRKKMRHNSSARARDGRGGMVLHFVFVWFCKRLHPKKNRLYISLSKIQIIITITASAFTFKREILFL